MAPRARANQRLNLGNDAELADPTSFAICTDLSLLCAMGYFGDEAGDIRIYRSIDNGDTWTLTQSFPDAAFLAIGPSIITWPDNIAACIYFTFDDDVVIMRSTNAGQSWSESTREHWEFINDPINSAIGKGTTWGQQHGIFPTLIGSGSPSSAQQCFITNNKGVSWSLNSIPAGGAAKVGIYSFSARGGGDLLLTARAQYDPGSFSYLPPKTALSTNGGLSWTWSGTMADPGSDKDAQVTSATFVTNDIVLVSGRFTGDQDLSDVPLWRSTDGGDTWSQLNSGDIASWPTGEELQRIYSVKRVTRDSVAISLGPTPGSGAIPWRLSVDAGQTFPIIPTIESGSVPEFSISFASMLVAPHARLLAGTTTFTEDGAEGRIWTIDLDCTAD